MKQPALGKRIYELRKEKGLTQEELVAQCNINVRTIQRIEAGEVNPRSYTVKLILEVLGEDFNNIQSNSITENIIINWSKSELKVLNNSWVFGVSYTIIVLIGFLMEIYFATNIINDRWALAFMIPYGIIFFITLLPFINGYKIIAKKLENPLLTWAIYIYIIVSIFMLIITFFIKGAGLLNALDIVLSVFSIIIFGIGELIMGLGILKLKEKLGSLAQVTGILKIVNGALLATVIFSPIALFFAIPILVLEVVFLRNTFKIYNNPDTSGENNHLSK